MGYIMYDYYTGHWIEVDFNELLIHGRDAQEIHAYVEKSLKQYKNKVMWHHLMDTPLVRYWKLFSRVV